MPRIRGPDAVIFHKRRRKRACWVDPLQHHAAFVIQIIIAQGLKHPPRVCRRIKRPPPSPPDRRGHAQMILVDPCKAGCQPAVSRHPTAMQRNRRVCNSGPCRKQTRHALGPPKAISAIVKRAKHLAQGEHPDVPRAHCQHFWHSMRQAVFEPLIRVYRQYPVRPQPACLGQQRVAPHRLVRKRHAGIAVIPGDIAVH